MSDDSTQLLVRTIGKIPEWIRHELSSREPALRQRAEEVLVAIIVAALASGDTISNPLSRPPEAQTANPY